MILSEEMVERIERRLLLAVSSLARRQPILRHSRNARAQESHRLAIAICGFCELCESPLGPPYPQPVVAIERVLLREAVVQALSFGKLARGHKRDSPCSAIKIIQR